MIRKNIRMRKEYLYAKSNEAKNKTDQDNRLKIKRADDAGRKAPNELRLKEDKIRHDLELADDKTILARSHIDDEYEEA